MLQVNELNLFFGKIIDRLRPNKTFENYYPQLQNIVEKIVAHTQDFESLLAMVAIHYSYLFNKLFSSTLSIINDLTFVGQFSTAN